MDAWNKLKISEWVSVSGSCIYSPTHKQHRHVSSGGALAEPLPRHFHTKNLSVLFFFLFLHFFSFFKLEKIWTHSFNRPPEYPAWQFVRRFVGNSRRIAVPCVGPRGERCMMWHRACTVAAANYSTSTSTSDNFGIHETAFHDSASPLPLPTIIIALFLFL